jgi:hypothetical protein
VGTIFMQSDNSYLGKVLDFIVGFSGWKKKEEQDKQIVRVEKE